MTPECNCPQATDDHWDGCPVLTKQLRARIAELERLGSAMADLLEAGKAYDAWRAAREGKP